MKKIMLLFIISNHFFITASNEPFAQLTLNIPGIIRLQEQIQEMPPVLEGNTLKICNTLQYSSESISHSLNNVNTTLHSAAHALDPQNAFLCLCGLVCVGGGVTNMRQDSSEKQISGAVLTLVGLALVIFSHKILDSVNT